MVPSLFILSQEKRVMWLLLRDTRLLTHSSERDQSRSPGRSPGSSGSIYSSPRPEPTQEVTNLLLFSIFAISARMVDEDQPTSLDSDHKMWDGGCEYLDSARAIMSKGKISLEFALAKRPQIKYFTFLGHRPSKQRSC